MAALKRLELNRIYNRSLTCNMNSRQCKKKLKKLLFHDYETKGKKFYSYKIINDNLVMYVYIARPKQKGCSAYPQKYILEELRLYGHKAAYEIIIPF